MKKIIFSTIFLLWMLNSIGANRFWVGQSGGGNYSSTDWATTSGGTTGQAAPTSSDAVTFDGAGTFGNTNCTITTTAAALTLTFTSGYTGTVTINSNQTLTVSGNFTDDTHHTWTVNSVSTLALTINAAATITSGGKTFPGNVTFSNANTKTLSGNWTITGTLTISTNSTVINHTTAEVFSIAGLTCTGSCSGTIDLSLTGGTWSGSAALTVTSLTFAGSSTVSGSVAFNTGTLTYSSGTVTTTSSTLTIAASTTLNTSGITWNNVTLSGTSLTYTINSLLSISGTLSCAVSTSVTFAGTSGFSAATVTFTQTGANTVTLVNNVTYTITTAFTCNSSRIGSIYTFTSDHATNKANLTLSPGASCNVLASFTRIDASGGRPIVTFNGTITTCTNIFEKHDYPTVGY